MKVLNISKKVLLPRSYFVVFYFLCPCRSRVYNKHCGHMALGNVGRPCGQSICCNPCCTKKMEMKSMLKRKTLENEPVKKECGVQTRNAVRFLIIDNKYMYKEIGLIDIYNLCMLCSVRQNITVFHHCKRKKHI